MLWMARRGWGEGSLYQRSSDGRWIGSVPLSIGGRRYVTGSDRQTVARRLRELRKSSTSRRRSAETVGDYLDRWLRDVAMPRLRPGSLAGYRRLVTIHIGPAIGNTPLVSLDGTDVRRMVNGILSAGLSAQTARHAHKVLRVALGQAVRDGVLDRNVAALTPAPRVPRPRMATLSASEARRLLDASRDDPRRPLYVLALTTGMRRGELLALRWPDVDLERGTVTVRATLRQVKKTKWAFDEPKTDRSRRTLPLTPVAVDALRRHRTAATSAVVVFARPDGQPLPPAEVTRGLQARLSELGLPRVTFHALRHTAAALMLDESGGDLRLVMAMLGHSTISTTVDLYGGLAEAAKGRAAEVMQRVFADDKTDIGAR